MIVSINIATASDCFKPLSDFLSVEKARRQSLCSKEGTIIPGYQSATEVAVRMYRPTVAAQGLRPALLEIHDGGFMVGSIAMMDAWCIKVALRIEGE